MPSTSRLKPRIRYWILQMLLSQSGRLLLSYLDDPEQFLASLFNAEPEDWEEADKTALVLQCAFMKFAVCRCPEDRPANSFACYTVAAFFLLRTFICN